MTPPLSSIIIIVLNGTRLALQFCAAGLFENLWKYDYVGGECLKQTCPPVMKNVFVVVETTTRVVDGGDAIGRGRVGGGKKRE